MNAYGQAEVVKQFNPVNSGATSLTHAPDALRGFAIYFARPTPKEDKTIHSPFRFADMEEDYHGASPEEREYLRRKWGL